VVSKTLALPENVHYFEESYLATLV